MYVIFWSEVGTGKERRLPWTMSKEQADALCKILNAYFSPKYTHEVRNVTDE